MSIPCGRCGSALAPGATACGRCGKALAAALGPHDLQYGMVDLGGAADLGAAPALETDDVRRERRGSRSGAQRRAPSGPVDRASGGVRSSAQSSAGSVRSSATARSSATSRSGKATGGNGALPNARAASPQAAAPAAARAAMKRSSAGSHPGTARAAATAAVDARGAPHGHGMMIDDDPFNQAFAGAGPSTALELESVAVEQLEQNLPSSLPAPAETPAQQRARQIVQIAAYGPPPPKLTGAPLYWVRVVLRKRIVAEELASLSAQRKRADDLARDAVAKLGEAFYGMRRDPRLADLEKQLAAVDDAESQVGDVQARGQKRKQDTEKTVAGLERQLQKVEREAAPLREREAELSAQLDQLKAAARRSELLRRKADAELETLQRAKAGADPGRMAAVQAERDERHGEVQTLGIQTRPIEDDLNGVRGDLGRLTHASSALDDKKQAVVAALGRAQQTERVSFGSARGARLQALTSLANTALKQGLADLASEHVDAVVESNAEAERRRQHEEIHRAALNSYDHRAYSHGLTALLGGSVLFFLTLALLILL